MEWFMDNLLPVLTLYVFVFSFVAFLPAENRGFAFQNPISSAVFFIALPWLIVWTPIAFRSVVALLSVTALGMLVFKLKLVQSTWLFFYAFVASVLSEAVTAIMVEVVLADVVSNVSESLRFQINYISQIVINLAIAIALRKRIRSWISKNGTHPKGYAITFTMILLSGSIVLVLYNLLMLGEGDKYSIGTTLFWTFFAAVLLFMLFGAFLVDRHYKRQVELERLNKQMTDMEKGQGKVSFESSVEFDLMTSHFGQEVMERFGVSKMIYKGANSQIYQLVGKSDSKLYTLKAMDNAMGVVYDMDELMEISGSGLAHIIEWGVGKKYSYSIKSYFDGQDLYTLVNDQGPLTEERIFNIVDQLKGVLTHLHQHEPPIVFRDVKPSNIIIGEGDTVTLVDVESARRMKSEGQSDTIIIGTRGYAPPEQYGFSQTGPYSDIYAVGATAYFMATGETPQYAKPIAETANLSEALKAFIETTMQFDPSNRSW